MRIEGESPQSGKDIRSSLIRATGADYPNNRPRLQAFSATADPRMKTICSNVRVEKNVRMLVM